MAKQILVPISRNDRVNEMIPYLERVAQPGMKVVFLLRFPVDGFQEYIRAGMATGETSRPKPAEVLRIAERYSLEGQRRLAGKRILPCCDALQKMGAEVEVEVYSGSLSEVVKGYAAMGEIHLVLQSAGISHLISRFLKNTISALRSVRRPGTSFSLSVVANCWPQ